MEVDTTTSTQATAAQQGTYVVLADDGRLAEQLSAIGINAISTDSQETARAVLSRGHSQLLVMDPAAREAKPVLDLMYEQWPLTPVVIAGEAVRDSRSWPAVRTVEGGVTSDRFGEIIRSAASRGKELHSHSLTDSEKRIAAYVYRGMTNKQIAAMLGRSIRTIENHRYRLMRKLKVTNVTGLKSAVSRIYGIEEQPAPSTISGRDEARPLQGTAH